MPTESRHETPSNASECDPRYLEGWTQAHAMRAKGADLESLRDRPSPDAWSEEKRNGFNDRLAEEHHALSSTPSFP